MRTIIYNILLSLVDEIIGDSEQGYIFDRQNYANKYIGQIMNRLRQG